MDALGHPGMKQEPAFQFIPHYMDGFNEKRRMPKFEEDKEVKNIFGGKEMKVTLDYTSYNKNEVEHMKHRLLDIGLDVETNLLSDKKLAEKIKNNKSQLFITSWKATYADAQDFLDDFVYSKGRFNNSRFKNDKIDK